MGGFVRAIRLAEPEPDAPPRDGYPWHLPVLDALAAPGGLALHPGVTYLVGENGSGKSTLLEALAVAAGMNPEGGSSSFAFTTRDSHSTLGGSLTLVRSAAAACTSSTSPRPPSRRRTSSPACAGSTSSWGRGRSS